MAPGARSKFGAPCSNLRSFGSNYTVLKYSTYNIARTFRHPEVIRRSHSDSVPGELCPCPLSLRPWLLRAVTRLNKTMVHSSNQRHTGTLGFRGGISICPNFCASLRKTNRKTKFCRGKRSFAGRWFCLSNFLKHRQVFPEILKSCPHLPPISYAYSSNAETWAKYWLSTAWWIDWFYVAITIFAQHLNICSPTSGNDGAFCSHLAKRQANVTDGCVALNLVLQLQTRRQLTLTMKRQIWHG